jgi:hypothetical protein
MNIIHRKQLFVQSTLVHIPSKLKMLYTFGMRILFFQKIESQRANARLVDLKWCTAKTKVCRLVRNGRLPEVFPRILSRMGFLNEDDVIAVDFSDFGNGFQVLLFAKQTRKGRAIPIYFEILRYPIQEGSQNLFVIQAIKNFSSILGFKPKLVFDRGFAAPSLVKKLLKYRYIFYLRIKKKKTVFLSQGENARKVQACDVPLDDVRVKIYDARLRLVRSDTPEDGEPWYLVTNDVDSSREAVVTVYYHRFEIEEFFRDAKHLLGLEHVRYERAETLAMLMWFTLLGMWFVWEIEQQEKEESKKARESFEVSIVRYYFELFRQEILRGARRYYQEKYGVWCL